MLSEISELAGSEKRKNIPEPVCLFVIQLAQLSQFLIGGTSFQPVPED
jgi:hypothetical protein